MSEETVTVYEWYTRTAAGNAYTVEQWVPALAAVGRTDVLRLESVKGESYAVLDGGTVNILPLTVR